MPQGVIIVGQEAATHLLEEARKLGAGLIVDGTQMDDLSDIRPGIRALKENGIRSPLVECGVNKDQVRAIARYSGLSVHNEPRTPVSPQEFQQELLLHTIS